MFETGAASESSWQGVSCIISHFFHTHTARENVIFKTHLLSSFPLAGVDLVDTSLLFMTPNL